MEIYDYKTLKKLFCYFFFLWQVACTTPERQGELSQWMRSDKIRVLSTTAMIGDLVRGIGGDLVCDLVLIQGELDPHSYELVKGDAEKFQAADLVFYHGLGLEHGASLLQILHHLPNSAGVADLVFQQAGEKILPADCSHDTSCACGGYDPHIWMDASLWLEASCAVENVLSSRFPEHREVFHQNALVLQKRLKDLHLMIRQEVQQIPEEKRYVITSHDAFNYFARAYLLDADKTSWKVRFQAPAGLAPDGKLTWKAIENMVLFAEKFSIATVFPESNVSKDSLRKIVQCAEKRGLKIEIAPDVLYGDAMGPHTYFSMMEHNAKTLRKYLQ